MAKPGDRIELSGVFDEEGVTLYRKEFADFADYDFSIQLSTPDEPYAIVGAVDISRSGEIMAIELLSLDRIIENVKLRRDGSSGEAS